LYYILSMAVEIVYYPKRLLNLIRT